MTVMFGYSGDFSKVSAVYYIDDEGMVAVRRLMSDGKIAQEELPYDSLQAAHDDLRSSMNPLYVAQVNDVRTAFKYLGKSSELIELLPEAELVAEQETAV
jgi:hypothetical protein